MWCYDGVVGRGCGVVEREWDGLFQLVIVSLVLRVGKVGMSPAAGLNGGWFGALGLVTCEWVGGCCCVGGWRVGMLLRGVDGGIVVCGGGWEG